MKFERMDAVRAGAPAHPSEVRQAMETTPPTSTGDRGARILFLFLLTINNSGSTALAQVLGTSPHVYLPRWGNNEGQFVPGVRKVMRQRPWDPEQKYPWEEIRARWESIVPMDKSIFLEKSPPNIIRAQEILRHFSDVAFLTLVSNPYSFLGSSWYRYCSLLDYERYFVKAAMNWLTMARYQIDNLRKLPRNLLVTYEQFCDNNRECCESVLRHVPELEAIASDTGVKVKGSASLVRNENTRNILTIPAAHLSAINKVFASQMEVLDYFGYGLLNEAAYEALMADRDSLSRAQARRADKDRRIKARRGVAL